MTASSSEILCSYIFWGFKYFCLCLSNLSWISIHITYYTTNYKVDLIVDILNADVGLVSMKTTAINVKTSPVKVFSSEKEWKTTAIKEWKTTAINVEATRSSNTMHMIITITWPATSNWWRWLLRVFLLLVNRGDNHIS